MPLRLLLPPRQNHVMLVGTSTFRADAQVFHVPNGHRDYDKKNQLLEKGNKCMLVQASLIEFAFFLL